MIIRELKPYNYGMAEMKEKRWEDEAERMREGRASKNRWRMSGRGTKSERKKDKDWELSNVSVRRLARKGERGGKDALGVNGVKYSAERSSPLHGTSKEKKRIIGDRFYEKLLHRDKLTHVDTIQSCLLTHFIFWLILIGFYLVTDKNFILELLLHLFFNWYIIYIYVYIYIAHIHILPH